MSMCMTFGTLYRTGVELSMKCQISWSTGRMGFFIFHPVVRIESICGGVYTRSPRLEHFWITWEEAGIILQPDDSQNISEGAYSIFLQSCSIKELFMHDLADRRCLLHRSSMQHCYWTALKTIAVMTLDPCSFLGKITVWTVTHCTPRKVPAAITQWFGLGHS